MDKKTVMCLAIGVLAGVVLAGQIRKLPVLNKLPSV